MTRSLGSAALCAILGVAARAGAQEPGAPPPAAEHGRAGRVVRFLAGAASGLAMHESGHLACDAAFGVGVDVHHVGFHGIPFFALSAREPTTGPRRFTITSAGFWVQHAGSEWLLTRRPRLREEHGPFDKGLLAFNVLASVAYGGAALARTGPAERDTRGMAGALRIAEPWVGVMVLTPAVLDTWRYARPRSGFARWASRTAKVGMVALVLAAHDD